MALQRYLSQLDNEQVAFSAKQRKPKTIEAAVGATLECESYLISSPQSGAAVAPVQVESKDSALMKMMTQLMARLEERSKHGYFKKEAPRNVESARISDQEVKSKVVVCF